MTSLIRPLLFVSFLCISFSQVRLDGLVAIVGNNMVLHSDVLQQSQILAASQKINPIKRPYLFEKIYTETVENIINQYVVLDVAEKDTNLIISDDEVDRALDQRINEFVAQAGSIELFEEGVGMSLRQIKSDYWREIRNMLFIERYKFSKLQNIDVSRVEVNDFYINYKDSIPSVLKNYTFSIVIIPFVSGKSSKNKVYTFLDSLRNLVVVGGVSFDSLAKIHSQDPGSSVSGGNLGFTSRGTLVQAYEEAAYSLRPGELSFPIRSRFGYHLIRLLDRRGEEISSQHILKFIPFSNEDKSLALMKSQSIYQQTNNDPFVFDSVSIEYNNKYKNFSGTHSKITPNEIPSMLLDYLNNLTLFKLSDPIEMDTGYALIYLYERIEPYVPNPDNSWNLIYNYAKQEKQNIVFQNFVKKIKPKTFIKTFY